MWNHGSLLFAMVPDMVYTIHIFREICFNFKIIHILILKVKIKMFWDKNLQKKCKNH